MWTARKPKALEYCGAGRQPSNPTIKHLNGKTEDVTITRAKFSTIRPEELTEVNKTTAKLTIYYV